LAQHPLPQPVFRRGRLLRPFRRPRTVLWPPCAP
jgi:hypothetical protein